MLGCEDWVNACILEASGTNDYKLPHGFKDFQAISAPIACDSEAEQDPVVRILDYEGIHPTLPSFLHFHAKFVLQNFRPPFFVRIVTREKKGKNDPENDAMSHEP